MSLEGRAMIEIKANRLIVGRCHLPSFGWPAAASAAAGGGWRGAGRCVRVAVTDLDSAERGSAGEPGVAVLVRKAAGWQRVRP
jgi:hypothetical protein